MITRNEQGEAELIRACMGEAHRLVQPCSALDRVIYELASTLLELCEQVGPSSGWEPVFERGSSSLDLDPEFFENQG